VCEACQAIWRTDGSITYGLRSAAFLDHGVCGKVLLRTVMFWVFIAVAFLSRSVRLHPYTRDFEGLGILVYIWSRRYGGIPGYGSV
jgi:hypothetical protein